MANDLFESSVLPLWNLLFEYERVDNDIFIYLLGDSVCEAIYSIDEHRMIFCFSIFYLSSYSLFIIVSFFS